MDAHLLVLGATGGMRSATWSWAELVGTAPAGPMLGGVVDPGQAMLRPTATGVVRASG